MKTRAKYYVDILRQALNDESNNILFILGAGVSVEAGIRTYRVDREGVWNEYPEYLATRDYALQNLDDWYKSFWLPSHDNKIMRTAIPSISHILLAKFVKKNSSRAFIVTQNIDNLEIKAETPLSNLVQAHGSIDCFRCTNSNCAYSHKLFWPIPEAERDVGVLNCSVCGEHLIPMALLFDEKYSCHDFFQWSKAKDWARRSNIVVMIGTSGTVRLSHKLLSLGQESNTGGKNLKVFVINPRIIEVLMEKKVKLKKINMSACQGNGKRYINYENGVLKENLDTKERCLTITAHFPSRQCYFIRELCEKILPIVLS